MNVKHMTIEENSVEMKHKFVSGKKKKISIPLVNVNMIIFYMIKYL